MRLILIAFGIISLLLSLQFLPKQKTTYDDAQLRKIALDGNLLPVPTDFDKLLEIVQKNDNLLTLEKIELGREIFFDPILSLNKDISCSSCHNLQNGGDDDLPTAIGDANQPNPFHLNSPTVLNAALAKAQFWNGRAKDVEEQAKGPIEATFEMHMTPQIVEERLNSHESYKEKFKSVFHKDKISYKDVTDAIGAYERTLLTRGAFDRFLEGDLNAINDKAKKGLELFLTKGCKGCHTGMSVGGQSMQKFPLRSREFDLFPRIDFSIENHFFPFENIGGFLGKDDNQLFRVPILRNISKTAPYFHNGNVKELKDVVNIMGKYQLGINFTEEEIEQLVEFLKTLDGEVVEYNQKGHVRWQGDYEKALKLAKKESKPILLLLLKDDTSIVKNLFQNQSYIKEINEKYIPVIAHFEHKSSYPIEMFYTNTFPSLFIISSKNETLLTTPLQGNISKKELQTILFSL